MNKLKQKIRQLESEMMREQNIIHSNKKILNQKLSSPQFMTVAIVGAFVGGFFIQKYQLHKKFGRALHKTQPILKGFINFTNILSI